MTTIIGIQGESYAVLCSDSRITSVDDDGYVSMIQTMRSGSSKIAQVGSYAIGVAGDLRAINLVSHILQPPQPAPSLRGKKLDAFITSKFIPSLRDCFDSNGYSPPPKDSSDHVAEHGSNLLLMVNATIYQIDHDYAWSSDSSGSYAIGTGCAYALGALNILCQKSPTLPQAKNHALKAIATAAKYDPHTGHPYQVIVQEIKETKTGRNNQ